MCIICKMKQAAEEELEMVEFAVVAANGLARLKTEAAAIPKGVPGICDLCGEDMPRLINGVCAPCRDRHKLP